MFEFPIIENLIESDVVYKDLVTPIADGIDSVKAMQDCWLGLSSYMSDFLIPCFSASNYFGNVENQRILTNSPVKNYTSHLNLFRFNMELLNKGYTGALKFLGDYFTRERDELLEAWFNTLYKGNKNSIKSILTKRMKTLNRIANEYPKAIQEVGPEFGFHFERGENEKVCETNRFILYRISPTDNHMVTDDRLKPVVIIPPYVLGENILAFLPYENRSYAHAFANQGIPTYIRVLKDIQKHEAVQIMAGEDDAADLRLFLEILRKKHGQPVTLNGYCQGGFITVCDLVSGELDGLVDALITCVSPIDGSKCSGLVNFLKSLPERYNDLAYGIKTLPNGNQVADGKLMSWVYKLKSIDTESPLASYLRDMLMLSSCDCTQFAFNKTATALNYWLRNDRTNIPLGITKLSFSSFNTPIARDGTLPVKLFGRKLNIKRIKEKKIPWLICYGEKDDLVEAGSSLAPMEYMAVETSPFPKGHVAIATSWSNPKSKYALHTRFGKGKHRGPVRFQLDQNSYLP
ncbi:MAG: metal transporter [Proteobacteria bacterium]|nr:metal transporter [Pseudomonadota bacterium]